MMYNPQANGLFNFPTNGSSNTNGNTAYKNEQELHESGAQQQQQPHQQQQQQTNKNGARRNNNNSQTAWPAAQQSYSIYPCDPCSTSRMDPNNSNNGVSQVNNHSTGGTSNSQSMLSSASSKVSNTKSKSSAVPADTALILLNMAKEARLNAYCVYSKFPVGAALLSQGGKIFTGANVENASYGLTVCAERSAICHAVSAGHRQFVAIAIVTDLPQHAYPCGMCRQTLVEFGGMEVLVASSQDISNYHRLPAADLLPHSFTSADLTAHSEYRLKNGGSNGVTN